MIYRAHLGLDEVNFFTSMQASDILWGGQVRTAAVHASVDGLKDKRAALEREVGELLTRHKHLTVQQPWAQQHVRAPLLVINLSHNDS